MSVVGRPPPDPRTILAALDYGAERTMREAQSIVAPLVAQHVPRRTGALAAAYRPKLARTTTGRGLTVGIRRGTPHGATTAARVARWVQSGTGLYGYSKQRIHAKGLHMRMNLGGRKVWSVKGQRPNPFLDEIAMVATPRILALAYREAERTGSDAARLLGL